MSTYYINDFDSGWAVYAG